MIIPFFGFFNFSKAPVTWILVVINVLVLGFANFNQLGKIPLEKDRLLSDPWFASRTAVIFSHYILKHPDEYTPLTRTLAQEYINKRKPSTADVMFQLAINDERFSRDIASEFVVSDRVEQKTWREKFDNFHSRFNDDPSMNGAIKSQGLNWKQFISYQFMHASYLHLVSNIIFLVIFAGAIEQSLSGIAVIVLYILAGIAGAALFVYSDGGFNSRMVGASGSVSGLVGFFCAYYWSYSVRYAFTLFIPRKEYYGIVYLPAWIAMLTFFLSDLAGFFEAYALPTSHIAHSAHIGGMIFGLTAGFLFSYAENKWAPHRAISKAQRISTGPFGRVIY